MKEWGTFESINKLPLQGYLN